MSHDFWYVLHRTQEHEEGWCLHAADMPKDLAQATYRELKANGDTTVLGYGSAWRLSF